MTKRRAAVRVVTATPTTDRSLAAMTELRLVRINRVQLSGRVVQDFAVRYAPDNTPVVAFRLAFNRWVKQDGRWQEIPSFIGVLAAGKLAERCAEHLHKGSAVYLEGRLQSRSYRPGSGTPRTVVEIRADQVQFLEREAAPEEAENAGSHETHGGPSRPEEGELFPDLESEEESSPS
jgi:single-strand DNA-binding protein